VHKCYYKPNRKKPRVFTAQDAARIAKYAVNSGADPKQLLAYIAVSLGLGYLFCIAARSIDNIASISSILLKISGAIGLAVFLDFALQIITNRWYVKFSLIRKLTIVGLIISLTLEPILKAAKSLIDNAEIVVAGAGVMHELCSKVKAAREAAGEALGEEYNDIKDIITD
jgi:hypothetical protein